MKGNSKVISQLNALLGMEMTAVDQYFIHSEMCADWGLKALHDHIHHEMEEELDHAKQLIQRILFLEGTPNISSRKALNVGKTVPAILKNDLKLEISVVKALRAAIAVCESAGDYESRHILTGLLEDTEMDHTYWLEKQLRLIDAMGLENYVQSQAS